MKAVAGIILAGGQARRMGGGDKTLLPLAGTTLLDKVVRCLRPQVTTLALNANGPPQRFARFGLPVIADVIEGQLGPLAGILSGLQWAQDQGLGWVATVAADTPLFPADLVSRLMAAVDQGANAAIAASNGRDHPTCGLWSTGLIAPLRQSLEHEQRGVWRFAMAQAAVTVDWSASPVDPFFNVNTAEDLHRLEEALKRR
ncbi:molybdenum cofactor guanylyltransferase MobA [Magnetospirillum sulfuroxidans]|uniref:Molybdenum cofactor guanylyltransferase n=1 Tax=Magnetospirillum sulfuroxidans TaxID=611300 RepID=A0ABS5I8A4_9PROT|nr:molybdenum cofactor guanylyltransferase MobA [Magnetospirillum sulfuroxidans]MBR9970486.1 molybdenum cofactor guanylyltransferase MobA [Magnetospirillum sulfuroxidans]